MTIKLLFITQNLIHFMTVIKLIKIVIKAELLLHQILHQILNIKRYKLMNGFNR